MRITQIKIARIGGPCLLGFAEITFDDCFCVSDLIIFRKSSAYRIEMPRVKLHSGGYKEIASALDPKTQKMIDDAVIGEYEKVAGKFARRRKKRIYWPT
jgi:DNA-binding cell septation regulator SpoVG